MSLVTISWFEIVWYCICQTICPRALSLRNILDIYYISLVSWECRKRGNCSKVFDDEDVLPRVLEDGRNLYLYTMVLWIVSFLCQLLLVCSFILSSFISKVTHPRLGNTLIRCLFVILIIWLNVFCISKNVFSYEWTEYSVG